MSANLAKSCPWCNAPRGTGDTCPRCGANYAKAELIKTQGKAVVAPVAATPATAPAAAPAPRVTILPEPVREMPAVEDWALELKLCAAAIPAALLLGVLFHAFPLGHFLQRTFLSMPVHELGHAVTAWLTGHWAIPTLWKTLTAEERGWIMPLVLLAAMGWLGWTGYRREQYGLVALAAAVVVLQAIGTLLVKAQTAEALIVFGGDGMGMVLGTALMATFFFGKETQLYKGWLRWGFLAIGAATFVDIFATWWAARRDFGAIPFGEQEGVGLSDPTKLVDVYGWTAEAMIRRYVGLGLACLAALALVYAWGLWQARKAIKAS